MMQRTMLVTVLGLFLWAGVAQATDYPCGDGTPATGGGTNYRAYLLNRDPSQVAGEVDCTALPDAETVEAQRAFLLALNDTGLPRHRDPRKLRVVSGLVVDKVQADIDAVNAADVTAQAVKDAYLAELATNDLCNDASLASLNTKIDTLTNGIANLADAKTALNTALKKIAKCIVSDRNTR